MSRTPSWLTKNTTGSGTLYLCPAHNAEIILKVFSEFLQGENKTSIAAKLNEKKMLFEGSDSKWTRHQIQRLLENVALTGKSSSSSMGEADIYPCVIDRSTFDDVQRILLKSKPSRGQMISVQNQISKPKIVPNIKGIIHT
jgi:hypothetical protein